MHCLITHDDAEGLSILKFGHQPPYYIVYTNSEGSGKSTYTYAQAHLSLHCSTLRQVSKSNGINPMICSFVTSKSILFDLNYAKIIIRLHICINDNIHI